MLQEQIFAEIKQIPAEQLGEVYHLIHSFRVGLIDKPKKCKTVDEVFGKLYKSEQKMLSIEDMNTVIKEKMRNKFK
jgi:hypothetical protein